MALCAFQPLVLSLLLVISILNGSCFSSVQANGFWSRGRYFTDADVARFSPIFFFHPEDVWMPVNIGDIASNSSVCSHAIRPPTCPRANLSVLGTAPYSTANDSTYYLNGDPSWVFGDLSNPWPTKDTRVNCQNLPNTATVRRRGGTVTTNELTLPYVVQNISDSAAGNVVINFFMVQAMAGPETLSFGFPLYDTDYIETGNEIADHEADLQWVSVVIDPTMTTVLAVGTTGHGCTRYNPTSFIGTRPIIYSALNTHSLYGSPTLDGAGDMSRTSDDYSSNSYFTFYPWGGGTYLDYHNTWTTDCPNSPPSNLATVSSPGFEITQGNPFCLNLTSGQLIDVSHCPYSCANASESSCVQTGNTNHTLLGTHLRIDDLIGSGGPVWAPAVSSLYQTGLNATGQPIIAGDKWVEYKGRYGYSGAISGNTTNILTALSCRYGDSDDTNCPGSVIQAALDKIYSSSYLFNYLTDSGRLTSDGPSGLGDREVANSPSITTQNLDWGGSGSFQQFNPLPVESVNATQSASLYFLGGNGQSNVQAAIYQPAAVLNSNQFWTPFDAITPTTSTDIDVVEASGLLVLVYTDGNQYLNFAVAYDNTNSIPVFAPQGGVVTSHNKTVARARLAVMGSTIYVTWPDTNANLWYTSGQIEQEFVNQTTATGPSLFTSGLQVISWSTPIPVSSNVTQLSCTYSPGFAVLGTSLVVVYLQSGGNTQILKWAVLSSGAQFWTDHGQIGGSYISNGSPGLAYNVAEKVMLLAFAGTGSNQHSFFSASLSNVSASWVGPTNIYGITAQTTHNLDIMLHSTPGGTTYASWLGNNGWEFTYRLEASSSFLNVTAGWAFPPISPGFSSGYSVPTVVKTKYSQANAVQWPAGTKCTQGFQPPAPTWAVNN